MVSVMEKTKLIVNVEFCSGSETAHLGDRHKRSTLL